MKVFQGDILVGLGVFTLLGTLITGCSTAPYTKDYEQLDGPARDTHDFVRTQQIQEHSDAYVSTQDLFNTNYRELSSGAKACYKIESATTQWGLLEPEMVFIGKPVNGQKKKALIYVTPVLADHESFKRLRDTEEAKVFRIDREAPHAHAMIRQLERLIGRDNHCVRLDRMNRGDVDKDNRTLALTQMQVLSPRQIASSGEASPEPSSVSDEKMNQAEETENREAAGTKESSAKASKKKEADQDEKDKKDDSASSSSDSSSEE